MHRTLEALTPWLTESADTLAALLTQEVTYNSPPEPESLAQDELPNFLGTTFCMPVTLSGTLSGPMLLAVEEMDATTLASLMLGEEESSAELTKLHFEILSEAFSQMVSTLPESLYATTGLDGISVAGGTPSHGPLAGIGAESYSAFKLAFETSERTYTFYLLVPVVFSEELTQAYENYKSRTSSGEAANAQGPQHSKPAFQPLTSQKTRTESRDLDLILDVPMQVTAVLGNTSISMEELINLGKGSVLELDKLAGEPVELFVHGRQIAIGEVVVIDERFGVKILEMSNSRYPVRNTNSLPQVV